MTATRYFTSAALRPHEEVPAEVVAWLPRSIAVEYEGDQPVSGVWRSVHGWQRVCWYARAVTPAVIEAHAARHGSVPFWVIDRAGMRDRVLEVYECDVAGQVWASRTLTFDKQHMLEREAHRAQGAPVVVRRFRCMPDGWVVDATEQVAGRPTVRFAPPHRFPAPELAGDPYPCGGTIGRDGPRLVDTILQYPHGGRHVAIHRDGTTWRRGLATWSLCRVWRHALAPILAFEDPAVARLVGRGELIARGHGSASVGLVEELPDGRSLADVVRHDGALDVEAALSIALAAAAVAKRAHAAGHAFAGLHPELIYVRVAGTGCTLQAIAHRAPVVIAQHLPDEPGPLAMPDAAGMLGVDDATCLAQLVWFLVTGSLPFLAPPSLAWPTWHGVRHPQRRRQAWIGGAALGALLERVLFAGEPVAFDALVDGLEAQRGAVEPYR